MRGDSGPGTAPSIVRLLAYGAIGIPILGWFMAQGGPERITQAMQWTAAWVHGLAASTFAVIFGASAIINALVVTRTLRDSPRRYPFLGYPLWQILVVLLGVAWATVVAFTLESTYLEMGLGLGVAVASVGACVLAARHDAYASEPRAARVAARSPETERRIRTLRMAILGGLAAAAVGIVGVAQLLVVVHRDCVVIGSGQVNGARSFYTSNCGDFAIDHRFSQSQLDEQLYSGGPIDVTTQGYRFGLPPLPVVIAFGD